MLTNSKKETAEEMLKHAGILQHFDRVLSADAVQLVAAHSWDIAGAIRAGCQACFLRRPEQVLDEITPTPTLIVSDLRELAAQAVQLQTAA